jgi:hypothetical protein
MVGLYGVMERKFAVGSGCCNNECEEVRRYRYELRRHRNTDIFGGEYMGKYKIVCWRIGYQHPLLYTENLIGMRE